MPLTDAGRETARRLRDGLAGRAFAAVFVSPLSRATETAALAGLAEGARTDPDLVEWDYGAYEGRTAIDIRRERPGWLLWRDGVPGGESPEQVAARADRVLARATAVDGDVALVAHGHMLRMIAVRWLGGPLELGAQLPLPAGRLGILGWERSLHALRGWSLTSCPPPLSR